jgi:hypothetical protein
LKPRPNDLEMTSNSIFSILILKKNKKTQFIGRSLMFRYLNPLYDQFAAKLNLQLKPPEDDIRRSPNLIYGAISSPIHGI